MDLLGTVSRSFVTTGTVLVQLKYPGTDLIWEGGPASFSRFLGRFLSEKRSTMQFLLTD